MMGWIFSYTVDAGKAFALLGPPAPVSGTILFVHSLRKIMMHGQKIYLI